MGDLDRGFLLIATSGLWSVTGQSPPIGILVKFLETEDDSKHFLFNLNIVSFAGGEGAAGKSNGLVFLKKGRTNAIVAGIVLKSQFFGRVIVVESRGRGDGPFDPGERVFLRRGPLPRYVTLEKVGLGMGHVGQIGYVSC